MELPEVLKQAIDKQLTGINQKELFKNSQELSNKYRSNRGGGESLLSDYNEALAYAAVRMPATYGAVYKALKYSLDILKQNPISLLDIGAGTGAATWAASSLIDLKDITCLEREDVMINMGKSFMKEAPQPISKANWIKHDLIQENIDKRADLVIASYVLNEIDENKRINLIEKLWNKANMMLLIVEPGTKVVFSQMKKIRNFLIEKGVHIVAPCPHEASCTLEEGQWCHFSHRISRSRLHKQLKDGYVPYEDEKFMYLAFAHDKYDKNNSRILRHPFIEKGKVDLTLCSEEGIKNLTVSKRHGDFYKKARKAKWGDEI